MQALTLLQKTGLTKRQAEVYLAVVDLCPTTPLALSRVTGYKRPTIYLDLDELCSAKYVRRVQRGKRTYIMACSPNNIVRAIQRREACARRLLLLLNKRSSKKKA